MKYLKRILFTAISSFCLATSLVYAGYAVDSDVIYSSNLENEGYSSDKKYRITFTSSTPEGGGVPPFMLKMATISL